MSWNLLFYFSHLLSLFWFFKRKELNFFGVFSECWQKGNLIVTVTFLWPMDLLDFMVILDKRIRRKFLTLGWKNTKVYYRWRGKHWSFPYFFSLNSLNPHRDRGNRADPYIEANSCFSDFSDSQFTEFSEFNESSAPFRKKNFLLFVTKFFCDFSFKLSVMKFGSCPTERRCWRM